MCNRFTHGPISLSISVVTSLLEENNFNSLIQRSSDEGKNAHENSHDENGDSGKGSFTSALRISSLGLDFGLKG